MGKEGGGVDCSEIVAMFGWGKERAGAGCSEIVEMVGWEKREEVWIVVRS